MKTTLKVFRRILVPRPSCSNWQNLEQRKNQKPRSFSNTYVIEKIQK